MFGEVICRQPSILGYALFHCCRFISISSIILGQGSFPVGLLPTWAPRHQVVSLSLRIWIESGKVNGFWLFRDQCVFTSFL